MGSILTGFFAVQADGRTACALEGNVAQILVQFQGIVATISWSGTEFAFILFVIDKVIGLGLMQKQKGTIITRTEKCYTKYASRKVFMEHRGAVLQKS